MVSLVKEREKKGKKRKKMQRELQYTAEEEEGDKRSENY